MEDQAPGFSLGRSNLEAIAGSIPLAGAAADAGPANKPKFPVATRQVAAVIDGRHTEIVLMAYADHTFIVVSQNNKLGTLMYAARDQDKYITEGEARFSVSTLLGRRDDPLHDVFARQIVELVCSTSKLPLPVVLSLSLLNTPRGPNSESELMADPASARSLLKAVLYLIRENKVWS
eukprot:TRINITY_DN19436_c0_g1_i1.p1 TRINITY_DN19436_c0_g1~~TRINITY_DN19436_c0_g1_i1.p1  ORF type:complete len:177 (+),score=65.89 TRINITY_DN19436_c0_g1_i1:70-600(+)